MKHNLAHVHAKYQDDEAVICIRDGSVLDGKLPNNKLRLVQAWVEIHREDLLADWQLAIDGQQIFKIAPLK